MVKVSDTRRRMVQAVKAGWNEWLGDAERGRAMMDLAVTVREDDPTVEHDWLGTPPDMEDVTNSEVSIGDIRDYNYTMTNRTFQGGFWVSRRDIENDRLGMVGPKGRQLADRAASKASRELMLLPETNGNAYDGTPFFDNSRTIGDSGTIDNKLATSGSSYTQIQTAIASCRSQMSSFKDDLGVVMGIVPTHIVIPTALEQVFFKALNPGQDATATNPPIPPGEGGVQTWNASGYTVIVDHELTSSTKFYAFHAMGLAKPFIYQTNGLENLYVLDDPKGELWVKKRRVEFVGETEFEVGYGEPRTGIEFDTA